MTGVILGLLSALSWGVSGLVGNRSTRALGTSTSLAFGTIAGFAVVVVPALVTAPGSIPSRSTLIWLGVGATFALLGLWTMLNAYNRGALSVVSPLIACQGAAIAGFEAIFHGAVSPTTWALVVTATVGAGVVARGTRGGSEHTPPIALVSAVLAALCLGLSLFANATAADEVGTFVPGLGTRLLGLLFMTLPVLVARRGRLPAWSGLRWALLGGALDVGGLLFYVGSAQVGSVPLAGVLSSQAAAVSTVLGLMVLRERLTRGQKAGFVLILGSVTGLAAGL